MIVTFLFEGNELCFETNLFYSSHPVFALHITEWFLTKKNPRVANHEPVTFPCLFLCYRWTKGLINQWHTWMADFNLTSPPWDGVLGDKWISFFFLFDFFFFSCTFFSYDPIRDEVTVSTIDTDCNLINNHFTKQTDYRSEREWREA